MFGGLLKVLVLQKPQPQPLTWSGWSYLGDWDLLGSLYIIPFLVEQKIGACCFGLVPPFCALIPAVVNPVTSD